MALLTTEELKAKLQEKKVFLDVPQSEQISFLMQEVARLNQSNIKLQEQMIEVVKDVQKTFLMFNEELTRIAKLP